MSAWKSGKILEGRVEKRTAGCLGMGRALSSPPMPSLLQGGYSQNSAHNFQQHFPAFINTGSKKKSRHCNFLSTKLEQPAVFDSALDWQHVQLTALLLTHRLNPNKSQLTGFSLPGCSHMISVLFLEAV